MIAMISFPAIVPPNTVLFYQRGCSFMTPSINIYLETVAVIWIVCTAVAWGTYFLKIDLGPWGLSL
jgi:hypothetical protein